MIFYRESSFDVRAFFFFFFSVTLRELPLSTLDVMLSRSRERHPLPPPSRSTREIEQKDSCMCWIANRNCEARLVTPLFASVSAGDNEMKPFQCASTGRERRFCVAISKIQRLLFLSVNTFNYISFNRISVTKTETKVVERSEIL